MDPESNCRILTIQQVSGHLSVDRATVPAGTYLQWQGPKGTTAEVEFLNGSPFGAVTAVTDGQKLEATKAGVFPYRCSLRQGGLLIGSDSPADGNWGGEVEVSGRGGGGSGS